LTEGLHSSGYITDPVTINTVYLASALHKPLLLEGVAGTGKTQLAYAVADAARTTVERLQCYQGIDEAKAIGKFDESLQRLCVEMSTKSACLDWEALAGELHSRRFFMAGPLLRALECQKPCVLLIDELDKVDHAFEAILLELLSVYRKLGSQTYLGILLVSTLAMLSIANPLGLPILTLCALELMGFRATSIGWERSRESRRGFGLLIPHLMGMLHPNCFRWAI
jgi:Cdc6-like AAA superfamily ATPase